MPTFIPHPESPALTAGAITFIAEHAHAAVEYKLHPGSPGELPVLTDLHEAEVVDGWDAIEDLPDLLSPIVYPTMADFRARRGWRLWQVLVVAGVDPEANMLDDVDDFDADPEWTEERGRYNFASAPGDYVIRPLRPSDVTPEVAALAGDDGRIGWCFTSSAEREYGQVVGDRLGYPLAHATVHARAWQVYMANHTPRGFDLLEVECGRWTWEAIDGAEHPVEPYADKQAARAGAWQAFLEDDAGVVLDTLLLVDLWPEQIMPVGTFEQEGEAAEQIIATRIEWIRSWTLLERGQAVLWAISCHVRASDNDHVEIPPRPACLDRNRPA